MPLALVLKPGLLDRVQRLSGIATDRALAGAIGITEEQLAQARDGHPISAEILAGIGEAFDLAISEIATLVDAAP